MNGKVLSHQAFVPASSGTSAQMNDKIRNRFKFYMAVMKQYVRHSQRVDSMTKAQVKERINPIVNNLIEQYRFGGKFANELNQYIDRVFYNTPNITRQAMLDDSQLSDADFTNLMETFKESDLVKLFGPSFQLVLR